MSIDHDEMVDGGGRIRPAWRGLSGIVLGLGRAELSERARLLARAAAEDRMEARPGADGADPARFWVCDPIPLPLAGDEFARVARGLAQRAELIERVLADLYGEQRLIEDGLVPPHLVFGNRGFLRASRRDGEGFARRMLGLYAADLVRGPDGAWRVAADRLSRAGGLAAALEHRRQLRRIVPELYAGGVADIDRFFERMRENLRALAAPVGAGEETRLALLTAGDADPGWAEHVMLARELGCFLVRGNDLTLRDGRLWMKTLRGLKRVDVLLNRQEPRLLDPLELDWNSGAGVPGLMAACRAGRVLILNDPGVVLAEAPGIAACLPALAPALLGETLALGDAGWVWLGDADHRARVLASPGDWEIGSAGSPEPLPVAAARLSPAGRARLAAEIARRGRDFVARPPLAGSVAPTMEGGRIEPRRVVLRVFLMRGPGGWETLPGGFARALPVAGNDRGSHGGAAIPALARGGVAKDVLVLADPDAPEAAVWTQGSLALAPRGRLSLRHVEGDLPARVAEEFFSLGRGFERLELQARLVRALASRLTLFGQRPRELVELRILASCLGGSKLLPPERLIDPAAPGLAEALGRLAEPGSTLAAAVGALGEGIGELEDRLTPDMRHALLQAVGDTRAAFAATRGAGSLDALAHATSRILGLGALLAGLAGEQMVRGGGWMFLDLGVRFARADAICREVAAALGAPATLPRPGQGAIGAAGAGADAAGPDVEAGLRLVLELRDSLITYRDRYAARIEAEAVLDLVIGDAGNPRALGYQLDAIHARLERLAEIGGGAFTAAAATLATEARSIVAAVVAAGEAAAGIASGAGHDDPALAAAIRQVAPRLETLRAGIGGLRRAISRRYLDLLPETRTLAS